MKNSIITIGLPVFILVAITLTPSIAFAKNDINPRMSQQRCRVLFKRQNNQKCTGCLNQYCRTMRPDIAYKYCATKRYCDRDLYKNEPPRPSKRGVDDRMGRKGCIKLSKKQNNNRCYPCLSKYCTKLWPSDAYEACAQKKLCDKNFKSGGGDDDSDGGGNKDGGGKDGGDDDDDDDGKGKSRSELKKAYKKAKKDKAKAWAKYKKMTTQLAQKMGFQASLDMLRANGRTIPGAVFVC